MESSHCTNYIQPLSHYYALEIKHPMRTNVQGARYLAPCYSRKLSTACGQSYKHFMLVNYDSRVVIWGIFQSGMTLES